MQPSTALATVLVDELVRGGVREAVLAPGSRSAPLAYALDEAERAGRLRLHVRVDERSAGFLALGMARASGQPVVVVTTSGTAVANLHPAVLEAHHAGVPLVVLSADRPAELRGTGANQTTVQPGIFGPAVRWSVDLPAPESVSDAAAAAWRSTVCRALAAALDATSGAGADVGAPGGWVRPGAVHLNVALRDPLAPDPAETGQAPAGRPDGGPWTRVGRHAGPADGWGGPRGGGAGPGELPVGVPGAAQASGAGASPGVGPGERTLVLLGDLPGADLSRRALAWAAAVGWPVLAEPFGVLPVGDHVVPHAPLVAARVAGGSLPDLVPDRVVVVGRLTLFRELGALLRLPGVEVEHVSATPGWTDPSHVVRQVHGTGALTAPPPRAAGADAWVEAWVGAGRALTPAVRKAIGLDAVEDGGSGGAAGGAGPADGQGPLTGPAVAATVSAALGPDDVLVLGSSNAPRDLATAHEGRGAAYRVIGNRGLAGIDGTVSTAAGVALALDRTGPVPAGVALAPDRTGPVPTGAALALDRTGPVPAGVALALDRTGLVPARTVALMGDLTFLHDTNGLLVGPSEPRPDLTVVVVNDDGGGIFSTLEYGDPTRSATAAAAAATERLFGTPHGTDLAALCAAHHVTHHRAGSLAELGRLLPVPAEGLRVIEVPVDRTGHRALRDRLRG